MIKYQNLYYMLAYAFRVLNEKGYKSITAEKFENTSDLCAEILIRGTDSLVKRGLGRDYITLVSPLSTVRGRISISESIKTRSMQKRQLVCSYDEFSIDSKLNRIIKATMLVLVRRRISEHRKRRIREQLSYFDDVKDIDINEVEWSVQYTRNTDVYRMLIEICYLVTKGLIQSQIDGSKKVMDFFDDQEMHRLYEKFLLGYYMTEYPMMAVNSSRIEWQVEAGRDALLPEMISDVMLRYKNRIHIIDAKYYSNSLQYSSISNKASIRSGHLYQIFAYVKNKQAALKDSTTVSGMLLYAKTDESISPASKYEMSGNTIAIDNIDLNQDFHDIKRKLDLIAKKYLEV